MKAPAAIILALLWGTLVGHGGVASTLFVAWDYSYTNQASFEVWHNTDSKAPVAFLYMSGTNAPQYLATPWQITTNWTVLATITNRSLAVPNNGSLELFIVRAVDPITGEKSVWANHK